MQETGDKIAQYERDIARTIGDRIRFCRQATGMSQVALGEQLGVSYQQIQKYEAAANRVSAARLVAIAAVLGVPVVQLIGGADDKGSTSRASTDPTALLRKRDALRLLQEFARIGNPALRRALVDLVKTMTRPEGLSVPTDRPSSDGSPQIGGTDI